MTVADHLKRPYPGGSTRAKCTPFWGDPLYLVLLRVGFTALPVARESRELLPHVVTLARARTCGLFSVALSLGSPPLDVIQHPALWSSDFPPAAQSYRQRSSVLLCLLNERTQTNERNYCRVSEGCPVKADRPCGKAGVSYSAAAAGTPTASGTLT